jgi:hypothetical protein
MAVESAFVKEFHGFSAAIGGAFDGRARRW